MRKSAAVILLLAMLIGIGSVDCFAATKVGNAPIPCSTWLDSDPTNPLPPPPPTP